MNRSTAYEYQKRLIIFSKFVSKKYKMSINLLLKQLALGKIEVYQILASYVGSLSEMGTVSPLTIHQRLMTVTNFLEFNDIALTPRILKYKVKKPKVIKRIREGLDKKTIIQILNASSDIRLKTYLMLLACTGCRPTEPLHTTISDYTLDSDKPRLFLKGQYTKTKTDRMVPLTKEIVEQLKVYLEYKYRKRRISHIKNGKSISEYRTPTMDKTDLMFSANRHVIPQSIYSELSIAFRKILDMIRKGDRRDDLPSISRRLFTLHSFRRYVYSTISDLGHHEYANYFIGHSVSEYYRRTDKERIQIFRKIEPYLTFLDYEDLERKGADTQSRIEELEELNQSLKQRDKMKDDAIGQLSDQLMVLTARLQEIERRSIHII
jgi:integrase